MTATRAATAMRGAEDPLAALLERLRERGASADRDELDLELSLAIGELDRRLEDQLDAILHHPDFQALESTWSSLEYLVSRAPVDSKVAVRVLDVSRNELLADFEDAVEFDQSALFRLVYEEEFGTLGGRPYALLVADFELGPGPEDLEILHGLATVSAAAHAVTLAAPSPEVLGLESWAELSRRPVPAPRLPAWERLREREDARYLALVMPRVLLRAPYRRDDPDRRLPLRERAFSSEKRLWGHAGFVLAQRAMQSFAAFGWCTAIRGLHAGWGVAEGLPEDSFGTDAPGRAVRPPVEVAVSDSQERAVADQGLVPLCRVATTPRLAFFSLPTLHRPPEVDDPLARTNLLLSAQLPYVLAASRFAHYLKCKLRDRVGRFTNPDDVRRELAEWLGRYTLADDRATDERKARYPLRGHDVAIRPRAGRPGHLEAVVYLQPHFQVEDPNVTVRLAIELPDKEETRR